MIDIKNRLQDTIYDSEELIENCEISKTSPNDLIEIARILCCNMGVNNPIFAIEQLVNTNAQLDESIKVYDKRDGKIYGILILSKHSMNHGSPLPMLDNLCARAIQNCSQINGFLFILDERLRGHNFDRRMIKMALPYIKTFDMVWVAVEKDLKTHNYWKHLGLYEGLKINEATFYFKILNKSTLLDIYNYINDCKS